jgi:hypothetical protein
MTFARDLASSHPPDRPGGRSVPPEGAGGTSGRGTPHDTACHGHDAFHRTTSTEQEAWRITFSETLPIRNRSVAL